MDLSLIPHFAILDPDLTLGLPPFITAPTGMDAMTHAVEAFLCWTYNTKESKRFAVEAIELIFKYLERAYQNGADVEAREAMLEAAYKAGFAFTRAGVGNVHAIAHTLGGLYNTPHGVANAVILPVVLRDYGAKAHAKLAFLAKVAGLEDETASDAFNAERFIAAIEGMNERMGIPKGFDFIKDEDIDQMIAWALKECNPIYPVPVIYDAKHCRRIIESVRIRPDGRPLPGSTTPRYIQVDLTSGEVKPLAISEEYFRLYVGGKALAARLLYDLLPAGTDALAPEAVVVINTGPMNGTGAPSSSRFNMSFKNVMTGGIGSSNCGGGLGIGLRKAGFDGIVITGAAQEPVYIEINEGEVAIKDARNLWGLNIEETQEHFEKLASFVIGPSGENRVYYAGVASGDRIAGRCGGGAVLGSKNLKGLVCSGKQAIPIQDKEGFKKFVGKWTSYIRKHPMTCEALKNYGSAGIINKADASMALPTRNFQSGFHADADAVSGETLTETRLEKNNGCVSCPIRCERRVRSHGRAIKGPEYETLGLFGPNIDSCDLDAIIEINHICDDLGMDTISCAGTLAFVMELQERGGEDFGLRFGDAQSVIDALPKIAKREGKFSELANGSKWLSEKYGGSEYAIHSKGLELAAYEPRRSVGMGLGYATSNRGGCHLNGGYTALLESINVLAMNPTSPRGKSQWTVLTQNALDAVSSLGCCLFSAFTFIPAPLYRLGPNHLVTRIVDKVLSGSGPVITLMLKAGPILKFNTMLLFPHAEAGSHVTGLKLKTGSFFALGERCYNLERMFNLREGLTAADDSLPGRLTDTPQDPNDPKTVVPLDVMLPKYYRVRGWDEQGIPTAKKLRKLKVVV